MTTLMLQHGLTSEDLIAALTQENVALMQRIAELESASVSKPQRGADKGGLSRFVEDMVLNTTLSYRAIVEQVLERYPDARTTARSVASVACVLRRTHQVPYRTAQN